MSKTIAANDLHTILSPAQIVHLTSCAFRHSRFNPTNPLNHHHVAVVLSRKTGHLLASATNTATAYGSVHAEAAALRQFHIRRRDGVIGRQQLRRGVAVLSLRLNARGQLRNATPCSQCWKALWRCDAVRCVSCSNDVGDIVNFHAPVS